MNVETSLQVEVLKREREERERKRREDEEERLSKGFEKLLSYELERRRKSLHETRKQGK